MILKLAIHLDIRQRIVYKEIKSGCKESFLGRERNPQRTPNSFFAGFFIKPRRVTYQDIPKASLLPVSTESRQKNEGGVRSIKRRSTPAPLCCQSPRSRQPVWAIGNTLLIIEAGYGSAGQPIKSAGGCDDNVRSKESTKEE